MTAEAMTDTSSALTRQRVIAYLSKHPDGVSRADLHNVTGQIADIHATVAGLIAEGMVEERLVSNVRGKPRRVYVLGADHCTGQSAVERADLPPAQIPLAYETIVNALRRNEGEASRTKIWRTAIPQKFWIGSTIDALVKSGILEERYETDARGGLTRHYHLVEERAQDAGL